MKAGGHLTQALSLRQKLTDEGHQVVGVLVGKSPARRLPDFFSKKIEAPVYPFESPNFLPSAQNKQVNLVKSVAYNVFRLHKYMSSVRYINRMIKETGADVVINFYELLTGLTYLFCRPKAVMVCIAHQYLFLHPDFTFPKENRLSLASLKFFTRITAIGAAKKLALSFRKMREVPADGIVVVPPLLRKEVLEMTPTKGDYLHGYLLNSGFGEEICSWHKVHPSVELHIFWDKKEVLPEVKVDSRLSFHQLNDTLFVRYMAGARAYATTAGFESVCEAMYLGKPVLMVPTHIEQACKLLMPFMPGQPHPAKRVDEVEQQIRMGGGERAIRQQPGVENRGFHPFRAGHHSVLDVPGDDGRHVHERARPGVQDRPFLAVGSDIGQPHGPRKDIVEIGRFRI